MASVLPSHLSDKSSEADSRVGVIGEMGFHIGIRTLDAEKGPVVMAK
jgi:hypothetical protein